VVVASGSSAISWSPYPLSWPPVPILALAGILAAALPALLVEAPFEGARSAPRSSEDLVDA
jgi:hypothetical protein